MRSLSILAVVAALAMAGFGCQRQEPIVTAPSPQVAPSPVDTTGVDDATAELEKIGADEDALIGNEANDAQELGDDRDELNALTESSYELR